MLDEYFNFLKKKPIVLPNTITGLRRKRIINWVYCILHYLSRLSLKSCLLYMTTYVYVYMCVVIFIRSIFRTSFGSSVVT